MDECVMLEHREGIATLLLASNRSVLREQLARERRSIARCMASPESREGLTAFVEKRRPDFVAARASAKY